MRLGQYEALQMNGGNGGGWGWDGEGFNGGGWDGGFPGGTFGQPAWAQFINAAVGGVLQATGGGGGGGGVTGVSCSEDPRFASEHGAEFFQRARQYGVPVIAFWYGNMMQVSPDGRCSRIGYIGGPGGQPTYDMAKAFLRDLGTKMAFWAARQPEGGWQFYAPPNYVGDGPPAGFQPPVSAVAAPGTAPGGVPMPQGAYYPTQQAGLVPAGAFGQMQMGQWLPILLIGGLIFLTFRK